MEESIGKAATKATIVRYLTIISCRRYLFLSIVVFTTIISVAYSYTIKKKYNAFETILVENEKIINPLMKGLAVAPSPAERLNTIRQLILSRSRLLQVIRKLDLDLNVKTSLELEDLIKKLRKATEIDLKGKNLYLISYEGENPETVKAVVTSICDLFIEENLGETRNAAHDAFNFIEAQLSIYKSKLEDSENALKLFKEKNLGQLPGSENVNMNKLAEYQNSLSSAESELIEAHLQKNLLEKQLSGEKPLILAFSSSNNNSPEVQLAQLKLQLSSLLTRYTENYPDIISIREQIEKLEREISEGSLKTGEGIEKDKDKKTDSTESTTEALNPTYQKLKETLGNINIKINLLNSRINENKAKIEFYSDKVKSIPEQEQELTRLTRDYDVNASIYKTLLNKLEEARISRELEINERGASFQVIDPAQLPLIPSKPNRPLLILIGIALGLVAGFAAIYILHYLDTSFVDLSDARNYFKYPLLANVPIITCDEDIKRKRKSNILFFSIAGAFTASMLILLIIEIVNSHLLFR